MSAITSHVLDTSLGTPASGLRIVLERSAGGEWVAVGDRTTNSDGRAPGLFPEGTTLEAGLYRVTFHTGEYFKATNRPVFYPLVEVLFDIASPEQHHHIPLLLSPFGYSTYRGS